MMKTQKHENKQEIPRGARLRVRLELGTLSAGLLGSSSNVCARDIQNSKQVRIHKGDAEIPS